MFVVTSWWARGNVGQWVLGSGLHADNPLSRRLGVRKSGWFTDQLRELGKVT